MVISIDTIGELKKKLEHTLDCSDFETLEKLTNKKGFSKARELLSKAYVRTLSTMLARLDECADSLIESNLDA